MWLGKLWLRRLHLRPTEQEGAGWGGMSGGRNVGADGISSGSILKDPEARTCLAEQGAEGRLWLEEGVEGESGRWSGSLQCHVRNSDFSPSARASCWRALAGKWDEKSVSFPHPFSTCHSAQHRIVARWVLVALLSAVAMIEYRISHTSAADEFSLLYQFLSSKLDKFIKR